MDHQSFWKGVESSGPLEHGENGQRFIIENIKISSVSTTAVM